MLTTDFLASAGWPHLTENEALRKLVKALDPRYDLLSVGKVQRLLLPTLKNEIILSIKDRLRKAATRQMSITLDMWSYSGKLGFLAIIIHWLTENFEMDSASFLDPETTIYHGAEQIGEMVRKVLNLLGILLEEVLAATLDRGGNVVNVVELLGLPWVPCLAHAIHNAVVTVLRNDPEAQRIILTVRETATQIRNSQELGVYQAQQVRFDLPANKPVLDVGTRWSATHAMLFDQHVHKLPLTSLHTDVGRPQPYSQADWVFIEQFIKVLERLAQATNTVEKEKEPTAGLYLRFVNALLSKWTDASDPSMVSVCRRMKGYLTQLFEPTRSRVVLQQALYIVAFLDPRSNLLAFSPPKQGARGEREVRSMFEQFYLQGLVEAQGGVFRDESEMGRSGGLQSETLDDFFGDEMHSPAKLGLTDTQSADVQADTVQGAILKQFDEQMSAYK
uniref:DUF659 domain-containing protein n=1 Tax=Chromera velia CCMP2878 TaxID=1169474 RepID=A0A0G4HZ32_9ALVE|eukprot:Cvel_9631.t1-p1 / transcript=Cvel_9631.t1 / gene=Cvel_9631 / organism=Chromera_velia_CCMP2878 / gene_product=hypothetical protein / transcript_product=hypothetical protein / location=Cvel_scaffold560:11145-12884(-) / protein_length=446 / sequence_SO=supercontig / SO=protein_coding / is_pseudo=false